MAKKITKKFVKKSPSKYLQNKKKERVAKARKDILTANEQKKINQELLKQEEERLSIRKVAEAKDVDKYEMLKFYREEYPELSINELKNLIFAETGQQFPLVRENANNLGDLNNPEKLEAKKQAKRERANANLVVEKKKQSAAYTQQRQMDRKRKKEIEKQALDEEAKRLEDDAKTSHKHFTQMKEQIHQNRDLKQQKFEKLKQEREAKEQERLGNIDEYEIEKRGRVQKLLSADKQWIENYEAEYNALIAARDEKHKELVAIRLSNGEKGYKIGANGGEKKYQLVERLSREIQEFKEKYQPSEEKLIERIKKNEQVLEDFKEKKGSYVEKIDEYFPAISDVEETPDETDKRLQELELEAQEAERKFQQRAESLQAKYAKLDQIGNADDDELDQTHAEGAQGEDEDDPDDDVIHQLGTPYETFHSPPETRSEVRQRAYNHPNPDSKQLLGNLLSQLSDSDQQKRDTKERDDPLYQPSFDSYGQNPRARAPASAPAPAPSFLQRVGSLFSSSDTKPQQAPATPTNQHTHIASQPTPSPNPQLQLEYKPEGASKLKGEGLKFYKRYMIHPRNIETKGGKIDFDETGKKHLKILSRIHNPHNLGKIVGVSVLNKLAHNKQHNIKGGFMDGLDEVLANIF